MKDNPGSNWKSWSSPMDIPKDLRATIAQGAFVPLLDPAAARQMHATVMATFSEILDVYLEEMELRWRCDHVHTIHPKMPMEAVFQAVSLAVGVSVPRLRTIWYTSRRKSQVKDLVQKKVRAAK